MKEVGDYSLAAQVWALRHYGEAGPRTFRALMARFGRPEEIHKAGVPDLDSIEGLGEKRSRKISDSSQHLDKAEEFIASLAAKNVKYSTLFDKGYPGLFGELNDPPPLIFYVGKLPQNDEKRVAIVGSHRATNDGIGYAVELATKLAEKSVAVVSGMARGIDSAAHIGTLKGSGRTYAVLGFGFDHIYTEETRPLALEIIEHGGLISEYPPDTKYSGGRLVARNRLIVGLSEAVIIGEVMPDSTGTLDTATFCHELGKIMFIQIDGCERPGRDNCMVEKIIAMGAIPFSLNNSIEIIIKSLV
jgi:DNA processing protein